MSQPEVVTLVPPRHTCFGCGNCCFGHRIELLDEFEIERVERQAKELGVERPVEDGSLRFVKGRCQFLREDMLCEIHAKYGLEEKPLRCQVWPVKVVRTEGELRFGVDPGCTNAWKSWKDGPLQELPERVVVRQEVIPDGLRRAEMGLLALLQSRGATIPAVLGALSGKRVAAVGDLPPGMAERIATRAGACRLQQLLSKEELGKGIRDPLWELAGFADSLDPANLPSFEGLLTPEQEAYALEATARKVFLREAPVAGAIQGLVVAMLIGAVVCAWHDTDEETFGRNLAVWSRLCRFRAFWLRLFPEPELVRWVATGEYSGELATDVVVGG